MAQKIRVAFVVLVLALLPLLEAERLNSQITITAGTPIRVSATKQLVNRVMVQARAGNTGTIYLMMGVPTNQTCSASNTAHLSAELAPGTSTSPGGMLSDPQGANGMSPADAEDLATWCVDGSVSGDKVLITRWRRL